MGTRDRRRVESLEAQERMMSRRSRHLVNTEQSWIAKCAVILRPFQVIFGVVFLLLAMLVFLSLLLTK